jgi:hypothetical protein
MGAYGSLEYALTWKHWDVQSGPLICALRASLRPTSANGFTGWHTPVAHDDNKSVEAHPAMKARIGRGRKAVASLQLAAQLAGWPTPNAMPTNRGGLQSNPGEGAGASGIRTHLPTKEQSN